MERGVVVEAGMSCTDCDGGEPETLRNVCSTSVGQLVFGEADVRGGTRQLARRTGAAFCGRTPTRQERPAGLPGMIAIIAAVAPGPIRGGYDLNWLPQPRRFAYGLR